MQSTDRPEFEEQLKILCAGYDKPVGDRSEAYWKGLAKMSLIEFARCVEFCMTEDGPEKIPTAPGMWIIRKKIKSAPPINLPAPIQRKANPAHLVFFANRLLLRHVIWREGLGAAEMAKCLEVKASLVREFMPFIRDRDELATQGTFVEMFTRSINRISPLAKPEKWAKLMTHPDASELFPPGATDGIDASGTFDFR